MYVWMKWCFRYKRSLPHTNKGICKLTILPRTVFEKRLDAPDRSVHHRDSIVIRDRETLSRGMVESLSMYQRAGNVENTLYSDGHSVSGDRSYLEVSYRIRTRVSRCPLQLLQLLQANAAECTLFFLHEIKQVVERTMELHVATGFCARRAESSACSARD